MTQRDWFFRALVQRFPYQLRYAPFIGSLYYLILHYIYRRTSIQNTPIIDKEIMGMAGQFLTFNCPLNRIQDRSLDGIDNVVKLLLRPQQTQRTNLVNLLGGAWTQFMVHDWFDIRVDKTTINHFNVHPTIFHQKGKVKYAINNSTHWWDGSQIYGPTDKINQSLRSGPYLKIKNDYLHVGADGVEQTGASINFWSGLGFLHNLFAREHNYIVDELKAMYPALHDEQVYHTARLILSAAIAKIHTIEWTTAIIQKTSSRASQYYLWYGIKGTTRKKIGSAFLDGFRSRYTPLPQGFAHTQEFVSVYRMHPLVPDEVDIYSHITETKVKTIPTQDLIFEKSPVINQTQDGQLDLLYTLGLNRAGSLSLHNYPTFMRNLVLPDGRNVDMAKVEIYRDRERQVPKYNDFRETFLLKRVSSFEALTSDPQLLRELETAYPGGIDEMDALIGFWLEPKIDQMLFGETIYAVFTAQTPRRLFEDRFLSELFTEEYYTKWGMDYTNTITMSRILVRHYPRLASRLDPLFNSFIPWDIPAPKLYQDISGLSCIDYFLWKVPKN